MNKVEIIARRLLGWKLNSSGNWYDFEKNTLIHVSEFQPDQNLEQAMIIVNSLKEFGITYRTKGDTEVCFNEVCATGKTLAEAITNAAYSIAENNPIADDWF